MTSSSPVRFPQSRVDIQPNVSQPPLLPPSRQEPIYAGERSYDYEKIYAEDDIGTENGPEARFCKVYLDEAEIFDQEKIRSHGDNLVSLLVFASLFSAIVTAFVLQTCQALEPDQHLINNYLLLHQIEVLKAAGNITAISAIPSPKYLPDSSTHTVNDVLINGLFFTSLALSVSTALLSVLAKQWLQAYDYSTSGSARDRALLRQLRFNGLKMWKLDEIIGILPLILHASVGIFLIGLIAFLRDLHTVLSWTVITISGISFVLYMASIFMSAIDISCPYRIPLLYRPACYAILSWSLSYAKVSSMLNQLQWPNQLQWFIPYLPKNNVVGKPVDLARDLLHRIQRFPQTLGLSKQKSLREAESDILKDVPTSRQLLYHGIRWLHQMSSNTTVKRISAQAIAGDFCRDRSFASTSSKGFRSVGGFCTPGIVHTALDGLFDAVEASPDSSRWRRALTNLFTSSVDQSVSSALANHLIRAAEMGRVNQIDLIIKLCFHVEFDAERRLQLYIALLNNNQEAVPLLLEGTYGRTKDVDYWQALQKASALGHLKVVVLLLDLKQDLNARGKELGWVLQVAAREGNKEVVILLLEKGVNVNTAGGRYGSALHAASYGGHRDVVETLIDHEANLNIGGGYYGSALQAASREGNRDVVQLLLERGAIVNVVGGEYGSALQAASAQGHWDIAQLLLKNGADVSVEGGYYGSVLQRASAMGRRDVVELLLDREADVNMGGGEYSSALQAASWQGHLDIVELLLERHADVNMGGGMYGSALQAASAMGHQAIVELLLERRADVNKRGGIYGSALQAAIFEGNSNIIEQLLRQHRAQ